MSSVDELSAKYPKFKMMAKFKQMATIYNQTAPKVAYYCILRIAEMLNTLRQVAPQDNGVTEALKNLINVLKGLKQKTNASQDLDKEEIEKFVGVKFKEADDELRGGNANAGTIKKLLDSANLIELLIVFGPIGSESAKRKKWAKVQAVKMNKNLKKGNNIYDGLGINVASNNQPVPNMGFPGPQSTPKPQSNPFGSQMRGAPVPTPTPITTPMSNPPAQNYGGYTGGHANITKSVMNTPESELLTSLATVQGAPINMDLNSNFQVNVISAPANNLAAPAQNTAIKGSFLQSGLYKQNIANFYKKATKIQDYLKKARNNVDKNLDKSYIELVNCKKLMDSLLNN